MVESLVVAVSLIVAFWLCVNITFITLILADRRKRRNSWEDISLKITWFESLACPVAVLFLIIWDRCVV